MGKKILLIYHREDNDGVFSAAIASTYIERNIKDAEVALLPADYNFLSTWQKDNEDVQELHSKYDIVIMTDVSFNDTKYMKSLHKEFGSDFIWVDHHAPAIKESYRLNYDNCPGIRDSSRSAILNMFKYLYDIFDEKYNNRECPELFRILSAWDSWTYEREGYDFNYVKDVNVGITQLYDLNIKDVIRDVKSIIDVYVDNKTVSGDFSINTKDKNLIERAEGLGHVLNVAKDKEMRNIIAISGDFSWKIDYDTDNEMWRPAVAIFHSGATNSTMFKSCDTNKVFNGIVFKRQSNGNWVMSLYNIRDNDLTFHCGEYLKKKYKGGGHSGAAGCTLTEKQFMKILKNKTI